MLRTQVDFWRGLNTILGDCLIAGVTRVCGMLGVVACCFILFWIFRISPMNCCMGPTAKLFSSSSSSESLRPIEHIPPGWRIFLVHCHNCRFTDCKQGSFQVSGAGLSSNSSCWAAKSAALVRPLSSKRSDLYLSLSRKNWTEFLTGVLLIPSMVSNEWTSKVPGAYLYVFGPPPLRIFFFHSLVKVFQEGCQRHQPF